MTLPTPIDLSSLKVGDRILVPATVKDKCGGSRIPFLLQFEDGALVWVQPDALAHALPAPPLPIERGCLVRTGDGLRARVAAIDDDIALLRWESNGIGAGWAYTSSLTRLPDSDQEAGR